MIGLKKTVSGAVLGLLWLATGGGAGLARAGVEAEPSFALPAVAAEAHATDATRAEPSFDFPAGAGEPFAPVTTQAEPSFDLGTGAAEAHAAVAPLARPYDFGRVQLQED